MICALCGNPADLRATLLLAVKDVSWVSRVWGGTNPGHVRLCITCIWRLETVAGDAISAEFDKARDAALTGNTREC